MHAILKRSSRISLAFVVAANAQHLAVAVARLYLSRRNLAASRGHCRDLA